ncbi:unnamed protein product [Echinostoma caproni]|uniref:CREB-regulated transcription coactivator 2 n=1 Tax=Echinostoma caproni TaxID=27848 RepID=A0A183AMC4_9TREM|nr:unnamed protein product [Echinostoma caproni]
MMATKQLNSVNPRNFREKIELLKKKEAASTANFAAAIRDAREIRQIAGGCDPSQFKSLAVQNLLDRSLSKACSASNISGSSARDPSAGGCLRAPSTGVQSGPGPVPSTFPYRRVQRYASGDQLPSASYPVPSHPDIHGSTTHLGYTDSPFPAPLGPKAVTTTFIQDDPSLRSTSYAQHHTPMGGRCLYTAQTSLGPLNSSSPYCGTQVMGTHPKIRDSSSGTQHPMMPTGPVIPDERTSSTAANFNMNIDWRRYPTTVLDHRGYDNRTSPAAQTESHTEPCISGVPIKRPDSLRRYCPVESDSAIRTMAYGRMNCYTPSTAPGVVGSVPATASQSALSQADGSLGEEHMLPAKRPFTGSSIYSMGSSSPEQYSQMNDLTLNEPTVRLDQTNECRPGPEWHLVFPDVKRMMRGICCESPTAAMEAITELAKGLPAPAWSSCFTKLFERMKRCLEAGGEYAEKI